MKNDKRIVLFASGSGSNVENIANFFKGDERVTIKGVLCNNPGAGVVDRCKRLGLPLYCFNRPAYQEADGLMGLLKSLNPSIIVLAGFLWKIPEAMVNAYPDRIINIHPALLPEYGGKGMYGMHVHRAVISSGAKESGITIHRVNAAYDEGSILVQERIPVNPDDTPETLAEKVHSLEYKYYPSTIATLLFP
ncbi:phosphoribosylglycinamide formyltransferase [Robiginitalea aurantiaca]|uniref:Phosphoribosylglycinamide formyltransferase n=1 Tax=Robiginitalea aurantiaca TaxID=3056915 RepID=A0ABT7WEC0_9FLAO|nr:phosphoribosylglycinamide formyltransferase [Robiginitalea aurantiaca]MDM9631223.1 phosphoribosylglycinamide formyltransferase [Robiginitalea aurantiaca]